MNIASGSLKIEQENPSVWGRASIHQPLPPTPHFPPAPWVSSSQENWLWPLLPSSSVPPMADSTHDFHCNFSYPISALTNLVFVFSNLFKSLYFADCHTIPFLLFKKHWILFPFIHQYYIFNGSFWGHEYNVCTQATIWNQKPFQFLFSSGGRTEAYHCSEPMTKKMGKMASLNTLIKRKFSLCTGSKSRFNSRASTPWAVVPGGTFLKGSLCPFFLIHIIKDNTSTSFKGWYEHWKKAPCLTQRSANVLCMASLFSDGRLQYFCWKCARVKSNTILIYIYISMKNHTRLIWKKKWHYRWQTTGVKQGWGWKRSLSLSNATR